MSSECLVRMEDVTVRYGRTVALEDVTLEFDEGVHVLYGPNGSGKTTLLRVIAGLIKPVKGAVRVCDRDPRRALLSGKRLVSGLIGYESLPFWLKTGQYLSLFQNLLCGDGECGGVVDLLGVKGFYHTGMSGLSSGMAKKVLLTISLMGPSRILLLDEPFTYIDAQARDRVVEAVEETKKGRIVIIASHFIPGNLDVDRIVFLDNGVVRRILDKRNVNGVEDYIIYARLKLREITSESARYLFEEVGAKSIVREDGYYYVVVNGRGLEECTRTGVCTGEYRIRF